MSDDNKSEFIAEYQILQGAITAASHVIIQVLGFSIAAIIALIVASLTTKTVYPLYIVLFLILFAEYFVKNPTNLIIEKKHT